MQPQDELVAELAAEVRGDVDFSRRRRAEYSSDASNYRRVPAGVVYPRDAEDAEAAVAVCARHGMPITTRGSGTSIAGNAVSDGIVLDLSRYLTRIIEIDPEARTATVEPGVIPDVLNGEAARYGLRFGPDPSTHGRCTIGGMIGNDACGSHSVAWGRTSDAVVELDVLCYDGTRLRVGAARGVAAEQRCARPGREGELHTALRDLAGRYRAVLRTELGQFSRQVSGYGLHHLLEENGRDVARALVGSEGTCAIVLAATVRLVERPSEERLVIAGFTDSVAAADAVPRVLARNPLTCEGMDDRILDVLRTRRPESIPDGVLPDGMAWLLIDIDGPQRTADELIADLSDVSGWCGAVTVSDPATRKAVYRIREDGSGLATRSSDGTMSWPGWEDAAVPPERLGGYLRDFHRLLEEYGLFGVVYGHFGEGCLHVRLDFDLSSERGVTRFEEFLGSAAELVASYGGALSGEHGDGRARSAYLPAMYSAEALAAFAEFKAIWDPAGKLNPGVIVEPERAGQGLRMGPDHRWRELPTALALHADGGSIGTAVHRCIGVGKCLMSSGGVMCPSYRATRNETDSTRGRARVLQEMLLGETVRDGWQSAEVGEALDLCLACKGCKSDCPVGVDMATYKVEYLHQRYRRRLRPASHYTMGWLPLLARLASRTPRLVNAVSSSRASGPLKRAGGIAAERELPRFADQTFLHWFARRPYPSGTRYSADPERTVLLWADTFTNFFAPHIGAAAVEVLEAAGFAVLVPERSYCCGLTWMSTGQLGMARRQLRRSLGSAGPLVDAGVPLVVLEPSCAALFRADATELLPTDGRARTVAGGTYTLAEFLRGYAADWLAAEDERPVVSATARIQVHCHQHAIMGAAADEEVLRAAGAEARQLDAGCCGLAGNFGFEREHYETSRLVAEQGVLPALAGCPEETTVVSDGFSCRTQLAELAGVPSAHLAELLRDGLPDRRPG
ncbi:FAD-linked oxidase C-terminal domain-containing protein [Haloechinothrix sp. LS1_15]|uniref:FAD-binding and (Fe-S)-binding domain-containing protein n=1 Tax=Haloechinothrix sp. LS1_15 TaxID=2652248 RepID=UPI002944B952|nr:FAD-linked oxidase C-terminal domain-containing protein [Haloechinothrix sp. LS1_15]MDV6013748.1 FAD-binding protein [Haloechinothrix sp. LS1_15]